MSLSPNDEIPAAILSMLIGYGADISSSRPSDDVYIRAAERLCSLRLLTAAQGEMEDNIWFSITEEVQQGSLELSEHWQHQPTSDSGGASKRGRWVDITHTLLTEYIASHGIEIWVVPHLTHLAAVEADEYLKEPSEQEYAATMSQCSSELLSRPNFQNVHWELALARVLSARGCLEEALKVFTSQMRMERERLEDGSNIADVLLLQELCLPLSEIYRQQKEYGSAIEVLQFFSQRGLSSRENTVIEDIYSQLAELHALRDSDSEHVGFHSFVYSSFVASSVASSQPNRAKAALRVGEAQFSFEPSARVTEESLLLAIHGFSHSPKRTEEEARAWLYLAAVHRSRGNKFEALKCSIESLWVYQALRPEKTEWDLFDKCIQSFFYRLGSVERSLPLSTRSQVESGIKQLLYTLQSPE